MTWMQTRDGHAVDLLRPDLSALTIEEVAHALARISRFSGHTRGEHIYSVAQHSVHVYEHAASLEGLLHDAHEAILGDITSPVKAALRALGGTSALDTLDGGLAAAVRQRFGAATSMPRPVKVADLRMLATERRDLLGPEALPWNLRVDGHQVEPYDWHVRPWTIAESEQTFLSVFHELDI